MVLYAYNLSTQKVQAGGPEFQVYPWLLSNSEVKLDDKKITLN